jgi:hypothetical protein
LFNPVSDAYYVAIRGKLQEFLSRIVANCLSARAATVSLQIPSSQPSISNKLSSFSYPIKAFWLIQSVTELIQEKRRLLIADFL